jgi:hypothetical protein
MKRLLIIFLFVTFSVSAQKIGADVIKFDSITSTVRNGYNVPYGERWLIWNGTTGEFEYSNGDDVWTTVGGVFSTEWGDITGTLSSQTDLQSALDLKANASSLAGYLPLSGGTMTGLITMDGNSIHQVGEITGLTGNGGLRDFLYLKLTAFNGSGIPANYNQRGTIYSNVIDNKLYHHNGTSFLPLAYVDDISGAGTDDQTLSLGSNAAMNALSIAIEDGNSINLAEDVQDEVADMFATGTHVGATVTYNDVNGGMSINVTGGSGLTAEQANRIENIEKIKSFIKTANFLWSPADVTTSTGTTDNAKGSIVTNQTGTSIEGEMQDADVCEGCKIRVRNIGAASEIVTYFADGETGLFRNLAGTTGNEWTVGGSSQFLGTKEAGVITVDGGTVATRTFGPNLGPELAINPSFDVGTGYFLNNGSSISGGNANVIAAGNISAGVANWSVWQNDIPVTNTNLHRLTATVTRVSGTGDFVIGNRFTKIYDQPLTGTVSIVVDFNPTVDNNDIIFGGDTVGNQFTISEWSIKLILP